MNQNILDKDKYLFLPVYKRIPIEIIRGEGVYLIDKDDKRYLDLFSGLGVNALGYAHPQIIQAVTEQIRKYGHLSNNFLTDVQIQFTELLLKYSGMSKAFLTNSGTEAIEGVLKIIRKKHGPDKIIYSLTDSFHGRTYGALTLTNRQKYRKGYEPLLQNISSIKNNDIDDLIKKINENTAAVFLEFIQGEGGINLVSTEFADALKELRHKFEFIVVADEIQSGIGRTGKGFAFQHYKINPDIVVCAKAIGGGLPLGAILTTDELKDVLHIGEHGTTFGGNPVCCAAGTVVLKEVFEKGLLESVKEIGNYFNSGLNMLKSEFPKHIKDVRGLGLMIGIELFYEGNGIVEELMNRMILANCTNQTVIRLLPPLILKKEHVDIFIKHLSEIFRAK